jgi:hypothetical protein
MLFSSTSIYGFKLNSLDGEMGGVKDLLFDDQHWTVRYLVAKTDGWLTCRQVLIPPHARLRVIPDERLINVHLTELQIQNREAKPGDPHLRSTRAVQGYEIQATDGAIGCVADFIIDETNWSIRYLVIDTHKWIPGKKVLIAPQWIERVSWEQSTVYVDLSKDAIRNSPAYTEESLLTRDYESGLHNHYKRAGYWSLEPKGSKGDYQEAVETWANEGGVIPAK